MAYRIKYGDKLLYDPYTDDIVWDVKLSSNINSGISLSFLDFTIPRTHSLANVIKEKDGVVTVYSGEFKLFEGYIENIGTDIYDSRSVSCCSAMNYLYDTMVRPYSTEAKEEPLKAPAEIDKLFKWYIDQHNSRAMNSKQRFTIGVNQGLTLKQSGLAYARNSQLPTTADEIADKILSMGGYLFLRFEKDLKILDLYADIHESNSQLIDFGVNLVDFSKVVATDSQYTAIRPIGGTPEKKNPKDPDPKPVTIEGLANGATSIDNDMMKRNDVVYSISNVTRYGYREFAWNENETTNPDTLLRLAISELRKVLNPEISIDIKGIDLSLYLPGYKSLMCGQVARVRSKPHGIDEYLLLNSIDLNLQDPGSSTYSFGYAYDTLTGTQSKFIKSLNSSINSQLDRVDAIDKEAKDAAEKADDANKKVEKAIISVTDQFYQSTSPTELKGGAWVETNTWEQGKFTWRRSLNVYGDYTTEYVPSETGICISGNTGPEGPPGFDGRGIQSYTVEYQISSDGTNHPTGGVWSASPLVATDDQPYLWVKNTILYTDGSKNVFYSVSPKGSKGLQGDQGDQGVPGTPGTDGQTSYLHIAYANSADGKTGFSTTDSTNKLYIGQYTDFVSADSTDPDQYDWTRIKGDQGTSITITNQSVSYQNSFSGTEPPDTWLPTSPEPIKGSYLWTRTIVTYSDGRQTVAYSIAYNGTNGKDGSMIYATSDTASATKDKVATITSGTMNLVVGATVSVTFTNTNTASAPTLNVNNTGAKPIMTSGVAYAYWAAGATAVFVYSGSHWMSASTPVYAPTSTIGNPVGGNVYTDSTSINIRSGSTKVASFSKNTVELGMDKAASTIYMCGKAGKISMTDTSLQFSNDAAVDANTNSQSMISLGASPNGSAILELNCGTYNTNVWSPTSMIFFGGKGNTPRIEVNLTDKGEKYYLFYLRKNLNESYPVLRDMYGGDNYIRTTTNGILPYGNGQSYLGTDAWRFLHMYATNVHAGGALITGDANWIYTKGVAATTICTNMNSVYKVYGMKLIYSGNTNTTFTLNESAANFAFIHITFRTNDNIYDSTTIASPNGRTITLGTGAITAAAGQGWYKSKQFKISGTSVAYNGYAGESGIGGVNGGTNYMNSIYVVNVYGYK